MELVVMIFIALSAIVIAVVPVTALLRSEAAEGRRRALVRDGGQARVGAVGST